MLRTLRNNVVEYLRANIVAYFFITLIILVGVVVGALAVKTLPDDQKTELVSYLRIFLQGLNSGTAAATADSGTFFGVLANNAKAVLLMWALGFTIIGLPLVLFIVFIRGFVIGFTVGFLVNEYVVKGLAFALVAVLPQNFLAVPAVIGTAVAAVSFSLLLARKELRAKTNLAYAAFGYTLWCIIMLTLMGMATLVEVYISPVLMKLVVDTVL